MILGTECCGLVGSGLIPGSALAANATAGDGFGTTTIASASAMTWIFLTELMEEKDFSIRSLYWSSSRIGGDYTSL